MECTLKLLGRCPVLHTAEWIHSIYSYGEPPMEGGAVFSRGMKHCVKPRGGDGERKCELELGWNKLPSQP